METVSVLISEEAINRRLTELAAEIKKEYAHKKMTMVCTLKGAVIFMADLARKLDNNIEFDFIKVTSYGTASESSGMVNLVVQTNETLKDKHVLLIEDIVDTGHTLVFLRNHINEMQPASFNICVLLDKPERRVNFEARYDFLGFTIPDRFVVGYGLDYAQRYRNLPYIGVLSFDSNNG